MLSISIALAYTNVFSKSLFILFHGDIEEVCFIFLRSHTPIHTNSRINVRGGEEKKETYRKGY